MNNKTFQDFKMYRIVSLNLFNNIFNVLEFGFSTYDEADESFDHWCERFPHAWIQIQEQLPDGSWIEAI